MNIPQATVFETGDYADSRFYTLEGKPGFWRRLKKPSKSSTFAIYDKDGQRGAHFEIQESTAEESDGQTNQK